MAKIVVINGNPSLTSRLQAVIEYLEKILSDSGIEVSRIDVAKLPPEDLIHTKFESEPIVKANGLLAEADAVIVASPVYKASYTGVLKTFLDLVPQKGFAGKITLPLFIGGSMAHLLAIDYALKPVLSALGARYILGGVYTVDSQVVRKEDGGMEIAEELKLRLNAALEELVSETRLRSEMKQQNNQLKL
ncbi:NADPH-dependent FMN reductase [Paenibacillus crassostreae]|uniref:FMN reductase n=1 Tax=Paenibacillus crassostreae TaxID=1763538 RepID=A0A162RJN0_9BACL|nr:NADPH-dependent FMN reductase [Paenibacillus crassostreae]AOZ92479.1 FMN reductase (NADPH) [Paenibacillus crassostreae]OAB72427.1 FMN reductase [Paenibacillus crassostreae]